jgi:hypothetical protein
VAAVRKAASSAQLRSLRSLVNAAHHSGPVAAAVLRFRPPAELPPLPPTPPTPPTRGDDGGGVRGGASSVFRWEVVNSSGFVWEVVNSSGDGGDSGSAGGAGGGVLLLATLLCRSSSRSPRPPVPLPQQLPQQLQGQQPCCRVHSASSVAAPPAAEAEAAAVTTAALTDGGVCDGINPATVAAAAPAATAAAAAAREFDRLLLLLSALTNVTEFHALARATVAAMSELV